MTLLSTKCGREPRRADAHHESTEGGQGEDPRPGLGGCYGLCSAHVAGTRASNAETPGRNGDVLVCHHRHAAVLVVFVGTTI